MKKVVTKIKAAGTMVVLVLVLVVIWIVSKFVSEETLNRWLGEDDWNDEY